MIVPICAVIMLLINAYRNWEERDRIGAVCHLSVAVALAWWMVSR